MKQANLLKFIMAGALATTGIAAHALDQGGIIKIADNASASSAMNDTGRKIDDSALTAKVKAELLAKKDVPSTKVHVKTVRGVVHLTGSVPEAAQKTLIEDTVKGVDGVVDVKNDLKVSAK
ncbi:BON domain-containing protein [Pandoraea captiosa]|uniref:BON domain-containing protein n=1 Tax=Pandoraea captiosa TaxID=2508302 RepID=A0A5E4ZNH8_9BURK|nr:BON domain-containing protein [Pandoraea captiosa]VVE62368.1 BON domain-containing protein [Pandoraea captiosa]